MALLVVCAGFFAVSFTTTSPAFEAGSLTSFILGTLLLVSSFEQNVKLYSSAAAVEGPVRTIVALLKAEGFEGRATYVPSATGVAVRIRGKAPGTQLELPPHGDSLLRSYESEIGSLEGKGYDFAAEWVPKAIVDALGLAESVSMSRDGPSVRTIISKPFVRPLCVKPFFTENVCGTIGCPLVGSLGQALALAGGKPLAHVKCTYDPRSQTATAVHEMEGPTH